MTGVWTACTTGEATMTPGAGAAAATAKMHDTTNCLKKKNYKHLKCFSGIVVK